MKDHPSPNIVCACTVGFSLTSFCEDHTEKKLSTFQHTVLHTYWYFTQNTPISLLLEGEYHRVRDREKVVF